MKGLDSAQRSGDREIRRTGRPGSARTAVTAGPAANSPQALRSGEEALHDPEAIRAIFLLISAWAMIFWRAAIKLIDVFSATFR